MEAIFTYGADKFHVDRTIRFEHFPFVKNGRRDPALNLSHEPWWKFSHILLKHESMMDFLERTAKQENGKIALDCCLFIQILNYQALFEKNNEEIELFFAIPSCPENETFLRSQIANKNVGYLRITNSEIYKRALYLFTDSCIWLQKLDNDKYIGLFNDGVKILSIQEWIVIMKNNLITYIEEKYKPMTDDHTFLYEDYEKSYEVKKLCFEAIQNGDIGNWHYVEYK